MKTYLITGCAGFIGSHLAEELLKRGGKVISVDNLSTGRLENIKDFYKLYPDRFIHYTSSVENAIDLISKLIDEVDVIFHLASAVGVQLVVNNPVLTLETNLKSAEVIFKLACENNKRIIFTSTSEVYGKGGVSTSLTEDSDLTLGSPKFSRWGYATSKLVDEHLALAYYKEKNLSVSIVRLFNTVGPRQIGNYGMVIPRFIKAALENKPIQVYGDGKQTRCFCFVGDTIKALIDLSEKEEAIGEIYNIGNSEEISILDLANLIKEKLGSSSKIIHVPYKEAYGAGFEDMLKRVPNTEKIRSLINWETSTKLNEIIDITSNWMKNQ